MSSFLFINQYYWPDEAATAQFLTDLTEDLVIRGHQVTILCGRSRYACREQMKCGTFEHRGVRIERVAGSDFGRGHLLGRLSDMVSFTRAAKHRFCHLPSCNAVIAMSSPPLVGSLGVKFRRKHGVPLVLWAHDLYPEIVEKLGSLKNPVLLWWLRRKARGIYSASAKIVIPGERMQEMIMAYGEVNGKVTVIPNWADLEQIQCGPVLENSFRKAQGWGRERVLMYSGNLGPAHEVDTMLSLIALIQSEMPSLRVVLVGDSRGHSEFARRAGCMNIHHVSCFPPQPRERLGDLLGAADAHLISQKAEAEGLLVPSKFYGVVAAGRPVIFIGPPTSEIGRSVTDSHLGVVVAPGQSSAGVRPSLKVLQSAQDEAWVVPYIRDWAESHVSRKVRTGQFASLLEEVAAC